MLRFHSRTNWHFGAVLTVKVQDMVNKIDDGSGVLDFEDFLLVAIIIIPSCMRVI